MCVSTWQWYSHVPGSFSFQRIANDSAGPTVWVSRSEPSRATQRCPWTWNVWCSEPIASTSHCTSSPTLEWNTGVLPTNARPSIVWNCPIGAKITTNSLSGLCWWGPRIESAPYMPPAIESSIDGEWSWYGHTPAESLPAVSLYVHVWPGLTSASRPEKPGTYAPSELGLYSTP